MPHAIGDVDAQCPANRNNYFNCSSFRCVEGEPFAAKTERFAAYHAVVLDDVGTKVDASRLDGVDASWWLATSPENYQVGFILREPVSDARDVERLQTAIVAAGLCDGGAVGLARWMRLPVAINGKAKHTVQGAPFRCRLSAWAPERTFSVDELTAALGLQLSPVSPLLPATTSVGRRVQTPFPADDVFIPPAPENPVLTKLKEHGLYKGVISAGIHDVTCPWANEHTDQIDNGGRYFEPSNQYTRGGYHCHHEHCGSYSIASLLDFLDLTASQARNQPVVRLVPGEINRIVQHAESLLAGLDRYYQSGGAIVRLLRNDNDLNMELVTEQTLIRSLAEAADWERNELKGWTRCDPPERYVKALYRAQEYELLPELRGIARQPYFREQDGELVIAPGYDQKSKVFSAFDANQFKLGEPTHEAAKEALGRLEQLLEEFHFAEASDRAAALSAMLTAAVRPSLPVAPAFNVTASMAGSGKTYLCQTIFPFAGPGEPGGVTYPSTTEEAGKVTLSLLMQAPSVIFFDDMTKDWEAFGPINRMLTSQTTTDRILGASKTITVSTRALVLGSGNNVEPKRDLRRRVITIRLAPKTETPAMLHYRGNPAAEVRNNRAAYVSDALTIIRAWQHAGSPHADVFDIASYNGAWADFCRHSLIWLGCADPATSLQEQLCSDPDTDALGDLLEAWAACFGNHSVTVRRILQDIADIKVAGLIDVLQDLPVTEGNNINRGKLGWYLKKHCGRIARGLMLEKGDLAERNSWRVVSISPEPKNS
jgi:hypothetical protein